MIASLIGTSTIMMPLTAIAVARERGTGTFEQIFVTPDRLWEIMISKTRYCMVLGRVQATSILLVAQLLFHIPFSSFYGILYFYLVEFLNALVGMILLISSFSRNMQQAMIGTMVILIPFMRRSGMVTLIMNMLPFCNFSPMPIRSALPSAPWRQRVRGIIPKLPAHRDSGKERKKPRSPNTLP